MDLLTFGLALAGLVLLVAGSDVLVRGASSLASRVGLSPLVIGLTVVAYGTSAPELAVSVSASLAGQADVALGNVVGSNIFNVLLILGLAATVSALTVAWALVRSDVWVMIGTSALLMLLALDGRIQRVEGLAMLLGAIIYTACLLKLAGRQRRESSVPEERAGSPGRPAWVSGLQVLVGLVLLVAGAKWVVAGAEAIARSAGVSELVIGLTIVAAGTSLPEVAASVAATLRGERDIAVGNVVGSNIFNILAVLGSSAALSSSGIGVPASALAFDIPVMLAAAVACLPVFFSGHRIDRWEGVLFLSYYVAYTVYLALDATRSSALELYRIAMIWFALPLTAVTLVAIGIHSLRAARRTPTRG